MLMASIFVVAILASTKNSALNTTLITLAIFLQAFCFFTFTTFSNFIWNYAQTKSFFLRDIFSFLIFLKAMSISSQCFYDCLLVLFFIFLMISATLAIAKI